MERLLAGCDWPQEGRGPSEKRPYSQLQAVCYGLAMLARQRGTHIAGTHRARRLLVYLLTSTIGLASMGARAWAGPQDEITRRDWGIGGFKPPPRWDVLPKERQSYPQLLAWASRGVGPERSVMTLVAKRLVPGTTLQQLARDAGGVAEMPRARNVRVQQQASAGWTFGQRAQVDAVLLPSATQRAQVVRQLIFVNTPFAYVLTLVTPQEQSQARLRDLDDTASGLVPLGLTGAADTGSSSAGASTLSGRASASSPPASGPAAATQVPAAAALQNGVQ